MENFDTDKWLKFVKERDDLAKIELRHVGCKCDPPVLHFSLWKVMCKKCGNATVINF